MCEFQLQVSDSLSVSLPGLGEHCVNHGWLCSGEVGCCVCGLKPLFHQITENEEDAGEECSEEEWFGGCGEGVGGGCMQ